MKACFALPQSSLFFPNVVYAFNTLFEGKECDREEEFEACSF